MPKVHEVPIIWIAQGIASFAAGTGKVRNLIGSTSFLIAAYHKILGSSPELVYDWLVIKPYEIIERYTRSNMVAEALLTDEFLEKYQASCKSSYSNLGGDTYYADMLD